VLASDGRRVPLSAFATYDYSMAKDRVRHTRQFASVNISFELAEGVEIDARRKRRHASPLKIRLYPSEQRLTLQTMDRCLCAKIESHAWKSRVLLL